MGEPLRAVVSVTLFDGRVVEQAMIVSLPDVLVLR